MDNTKIFYIGPEVNRNPAYSKKTLFVVGKQKLDQIERMAKEYKTPHIFLGADRSFNSSSKDPYWNHVITALLDKGFWVTLDYQAHEHVDVLDMLSSGIWQSRLFVPLLGVRIPRVQTSSTNLTIKIDDSNFNATNPGVWCMNHHEITDSNRFTDWAEYISDEVAPLVGAVPNPVLTIPVPVVEPQISTVIKSMTEYVELEDVEETSDKNDASVGLDVDAPSNLKPEIGEATPVLTAITNPVDAADAYADGATEDPLSANPKKSKGKK